MANKSRSKVALRYDCPTKYDVQKRFLEALSLTKPTVKNRLAECLPYYAELLKTDWVRTNERVRANNPIFQASNSPQARRVLEAVTSWAAAYGLFYKSAPAQWVLDSALYTLAEWTISPRREWAVAMEADDVLGCEIPFSLNISTSWNRSLQTWDEFKGAVSRLLRDELANFKKIAPLCGPPIPASRNRLFLSDELGKYVGWLARRHLGESLRDIAIAPVKGAEARASVTDIRENTDRLAAAIGLSPRKMPKGRPAK